MKDFGKYLGGKVVSGVSKAIEGIAKKGDEAWSFIKEKVVNEAKDIIDVLLKKDYEIQEFIAKQVEKVSIGINEWLAKHCQTVVVAPGGAVLHNPRVFKSEVETGINAIDEAKTIARVSKSGTKLTEPSLPKGLREPKGNYANEAGGRGIVRQNKTAKLFAEQGYDIEMLDEVLGGNGHGVKKTSNPDFLIEKNVFDYYSPDDNTPIEKVCSYIKNKTKTQATRIVLNLDDYPVNKISELQETILKQTTSTTNQHLRYLEELFVVRDGQITRIFAR